MSIGFVKFYYFIFKKVKAEEKEMTSDSTKKTCDAVLSLIDSKFSSDAEFERVANIVPKTVNNWRRGKSASFMKMLPELAEIFGVTVNELADPEGASRNLSSDEQELLMLYRFAEYLPKEEKEALNRTIKSTIELYVNSRKNRL